MKYKAFFEVTLINPGEAKFNNDSEQFEFSAHAAHFI